MKIRFSILLALVAATSLHATSISLSNQPNGRSAIDSNGFTLADGSLVLIGTFSNIAALASLPPIDLASAAGWTQFGNSLAVASVFGNGGKLVGTSNDLSVSADAFNGDPIYLWVFNGTTLANSTEYGVFTAALGTPNWNYPANNGGIGDLLTISLDDASLAPAASLGSVTGSNLQLKSFAVVPEPGTYGVIGLGALLVCTHRLFRRRPQA